MPKLTAETLLSVLGGREPVCEVWRRLGVQRRQLEAFINANYDALVSAGLRLHVATVDKAMGPRAGYITVNNWRYGWVAVDRPAEPAGSEPAGAHVTYRQEYVRCGKPTCQQCSDGPGHGPYWYGYWREGGRLRKKYFGKEKPV